MALSAAKSTQNLDGRPYPSRITLGVKTSTTVYQGGLVAVDSTGYAVPASVSTTHYVQGVALATVTNSGSSGTVTVDVRPGTWLFKNSSSSDEITVTHCCST